MIAEAPGAACRPRRPNGRREAGPVFDLPAFRKSAPEQSEEL